jgi:hypothetical protein
LRQTAVAVLRDQRHPFCRCRDLPSPPVVSVIPRPSRLAPVSTNSVVMLAIATDYPVAWLTYRRRSPTGRLPPSRHKHGTSYDGTAVGNNASRAGIAVAPYCA